MKGRVCLVTGATNGIGKAIAEALATLGATVLIHGRNPDKTSRTLDEIRATTGSDDVHMFLADFASLADVRSLAMQVRERVGTLHVLANNAGLLTDQRQVSADGFELTFAVNHLAPFLLTRLLLPALTASAPARISFNSSSAMGSASLRLDDLQMERRFDGWTAYANSKLANYWVSNLLAGMLTGTGVVSNAYCPGLIDTGLLTGNRDFGAARVANMRRSMRSPADGAMTPVFLATAADAGEINGAFFLKSHGDGLAPVDVPWDREAAEQLWRLSTDYVAQWLDTAGPEIPLR
ncbi:MAG: SDR family NAD(P)-dependent oxidoreductase [Gammaproteobacteria bacterium]|nr:SDR family NAD(P)-dependent oxidoreductase [Gammaproteobacteria bacterium]MBT8443473.1 SDR family NAD(P)-dependent oxidoreductase [Gammaproteobacteria bacterium]NND36969.1 SDR family NAD(P)-dependent oxidoreductase [Gammaproteobacteria bacterium]